MGLLEEAYQLFGNSPPEEFVDPGDCDECAAHNETLKSFSSKTIGYQQLGNPASDPLSYVNAEGFKYYFPAMVRLAISESEDEYYIDQFLFHLASDGDRNRRWQAFSPSQREFVVRVLVNLLEERIETVEQHWDSDFLSTAISIWSAVD